jgi:hypothetical protein
MTIGLIVKLPYNLSFTEGGLLNLPSIFCQKFLLNLGLIFGAPRACAAARFSGLNLVLTFNFFEFFSKTP